MIFTGIKFLYFFLPIFMCIYSLTKPVYRNSVMVAGTISILLIVDVLSLIPFITMSASAYICGLKCLKSDEKIKKKNFLFCIITDIIIFFTFLYATVTIENLKILSVLSISIYFFHSISYCVDVYKGKFNPENNVFMVMAYVGFLPSLNGIPIVRYDDISNDLAAPEINFAKISDGILILMKGIAEKVIISNQLASIHQTINLENRLTMTEAWFDAFVFGTAMYSRFLSYSHIAQGFGKMLGFDIKNNFNHPLSKTSAYKYFKNYNISVVKWFKIYIYDPITKNNNQNNINLFAAVLCILLICICYSLKLNFWIWGIFMAVLICIDIIIDEHKIKIYKPFRYILIHFFYLIGWTIISQKSLTDVAERLKTMFNMKLLTIDNNMFNNFKMYFIYTSLFFIFNSTLSEYVINKILFKKDNFLTMIKPASILILLVLCTTFMTSGIQNIPLF